MRELGSLLRRVAPPTHTYLGEFVERGIGGVVCDEELHTTVGDLYCSRAIHVGETALKKKKLQYNNSYKTKATFGSEVKKNC